MKIRQLVGLAAIILLCMTSAMPAAVSANTGKNVENESIYDLLVDRFNNGDRSNDVDVNTQDRHAFNGGDFTGIQARLQHILDMNFTLVSIGPVFKTETYDGNQVLTYDELEPHFGTEEEFHKLVKEIHDKKLKIIADFPMGQVSADHVWTKENKSKFIYSANGTVDWDTKDPAVREALIDAVTNFVTTYGLDGIRLTKIEGFETDYLNEMIDAIHTAQEGAYVITNEESDADFDLTPSLAKMDVLHQSFTKTDADSKHIDYFLENDENHIIQLDDLTGPRLTYDMVEARMFPPTRWKVAATALFTLPGIPLMTYGTEIAVNGKEAPDSHPLFNFKTDMEFKELIGNLNLLRNKSDTLRNGEFKMLYNKDGFMIYTRSSEEETWMIAVNNTTRTVHVDIPAEEIGDNKKLRGLLNQDLIKESEDGMFRVVLDREVAEVYIADKDKGFNTPYLIASLLVYIIFLTFLFLVIKKGRERRRDAK